MLIHKLKLSGFLSFGPRGIDLQMEPLNVLIGPNGSGKSNFLEALSLLKSAPRDISESFRRDGIREWLWKGQGAPETIGVEATVDYPPTGTPAALAGIGGSGAGVPLSPTSRSSRRRRTPTRERPGPTTVRPGANRPRWR